MKMSEHLLNERISALLDEPRADPEAEAHLERCERCRAEYERLSRMRMAISALGELQPPSDQWSRIEARLEASPFIAPGPLSGRRSWGRRLLGSWPLQAAAALLLFAGGVVAGLQFTGLRADGPAEVAGRPIPVVTAPGVATGRPGPEEAYLSALAGLDELRSPLRLAEIRTEDGELDARAAARLLARLNGLIEASEEAVEDAPGNPAANALLFQLLEERNALADELHLASARSW